MTTSWVVCPERPLILEWFLLFRCEAAINKQLGRKGAAADALQHWNERIKPLIPPEKIELIAEEAKLPALFLLE